MALLRDNAVILLSALAVLEGLLAGLLLQRLRAMEGRLAIAVEAAEDAARAAALAAPGGIDPEVVIDLIRQGRPATLDTIHELMERQEAAGR